MGVRGSIVAKPINAPVQVVGATEEDLKQLDWVRSLNPNKYKRPIAMLTGGGSGEDNPQDSIKADVNPASNNGMGTAVLEVTTPEVVGLPVPIQDPREVVLSAVEKMTHRINQALAGTGELPQC